MKLLVIEGWIRPPYISGAIDPALWICVPRFGTCFHPFYWRIGVSSLKWDDWFVTIGPFSITNDIFLD